MSLRGSMFPTWRTNRSGSRYWALTRPTSSGEAGDMSGLGAECTTTASSPRRLRIRSAVNDDTAMTASARRSACRTSTRSPATRCRGKAHGVSKMARSCTVETIGPGRRSGRSTSSPWVRSAFPNPTAPVSARRIPAGVPLDQRVDAVGQLGGTSRPHRGHQVGIDLGDHGGEELADVGADPAATGIEGQGVVDDPG